MPINNSAPILGLSGAALYLQTQIASLPIRRVTREEHRRMLNRYAQGRVDFAPDNIPSSKRGVARGRFSGDVRVVQKTDDGGLRTKPPSAQAAQSTARNGESQCSTE